MQRLPRNLRYCDDATEGIGNCQVAVAGAAADRGDNDEDDDNVD